MQGILDSFSALQNLGVWTIATTAIDILIVAFVVYKLLLLIRETRAEQLIKGIIILLIVSKVSDWLQLYVVHYILQNTFTIGVVALMIVFQPEMRRALEYIGRSKFLSKSPMEMKQEELEGTVDQVVNAAEKLSQDKIGALIVLERETRMNDIIETGVPINADVTDALLINVFMPNTPLHDGAIIIRGDRLMAAGCILPLTANRVSKDLGTRHRAALGIVEQSDAVVVIVSEETGAISIASDGKLARFLDANALRKRILKAYDPENSSALIKTRTTWIPRLWKSKKTS